MSAYPGGTDWSPGDAQYGVQIVPGQRITMDDGVSLAASVAYPTDLGTGERVNGRFPVIGLITAYTDALNPLPEYFVEHGYVVAKINERGTGESGGTGTMGPNGEREGRDLKAIVEWLRDLPGSSGAVGLVGISEAGRLALNAATYVDSNSGLKAIAISSSIHLYEDYFCGGIPSSSILNPANGELLGKYSGPNTSWSETYSRNSADAIAGGVNSYETGYYTSTLANHAGLAAIPGNGVKVLITTDWLDQGSRASDIYVALQQAANPEFGGYPGPLLPTRADPDPGYQLVIGPWGGPYPATGHGAMLDDEGIRLEWFDTWLKDVDTGLAQTTAPIHAYEVNMGWFNTALWPPVERYSPYYLDGTGALTPEKPSPVTTTSAIPWAVPETGAELGFESEPFADGAALLGPLSARIYASSNNTNLELIVMLWDVAPDGEQTYITRGAVVGSRHHLTGGSVGSCLPSTASWTDAAGTIVRPYPDNTWDDYLSPDEPYQLDINLRVVGYAVPPGHLLRMTLTTQPTEQELAAPGTPHPGFHTVPQQATLPGGLYTVYHTPELASRINLPILPAGALTIVEGGPTPTSNGETQSSDWSTPSCVADLVQA